MKNQIGIVYILALLTACNENKPKSYQYIEITETKNLFGGVSEAEKEARKTNGSNDSAAYLEAFRLFTISLKVNKDMKQRFGSASSTPLRFKLLNDKGEDIANNVFFPDKQKREQEIKEQVFALKNTFQDSEGSGQSPATVNIDSGKVKELLKFFRQKKDEYSNNNKIKYEPKSAPVYANRNGLYCYFNTENGVPGNLRFRLQYYADEWLFFSRVLFAIDGKAFEYIPSDTETDSGEGGKIWEWFDQVLSKNDKQLIEALANAKSAKMKIIGRQYYDEKTVTSEQIAAIKHTLEFYRAMGGQF